MSDPYLGEIRMVGFNFAPVGWSTCQGQTLAISANSALFALLGTTFGGNGVSTFQLPDLQGRIPLGQGNGTGLPAYVWGENGGQTAVTLTQQQMPIHSHVATFTGTGGGSAPVTVSVQGSSAVANSSSRAAIIWPAKREPHVLRPICMCPQRRPARRLRLPERVAELWRYRRPQGRSRFKQVAGANPSASSHRFFACSSSLRCRESFQAAVDRNRTVPMCRRASLCGREVSIPRDRAEADTRF